MIHNNYHQTVLLSSSNKFVGNVTEVWNNIYGYFILKSDNKKLFKENESLRNKLGFYYEERINPLKNKQFNYIKAKVVNASKNKKKNYITINKGINHGVSSEMGVISADGVLGITYISGNNYSTILPIINTKSRLSVKLEKNNFFGSLSWDGNNIKIAQMSEIPGYVQIEKGDKVVTSGFSAFFPSGVPVGKILSFEKDEATQFYQIQIKLFTDFNKVNHVYVIENTSFNEIKEIEKQTYDQ